MTGNAVITALDQIRRLSELTLEEIRASIAQIDPLPLAASAFGSFVRGAAGPESDIDVMLDRPDPADGDGWAECVSR